MYKQKKNIGFFEAREQKKKVTGFNIEISEKKVILILVLFLVFLFQNPIVNSDEGKKTDNIKIFTY